MDKIILERYLEKFNDFYKLLFYSKFSTIYLLEDGKWKDLDIYGTFVMYQKVNKEIKICIFNKSKLEDIFVNISLSTEVKIQNDILKIINKSEIYGIWFYNKDYIIEVYRIIKISLKSSLCEIIDNDL